MRSFLTVVIFPLFFGLFAILTVYALVRYGILAAVFAIGGFGVLPFLVRGAKGAIRKRRKNEFEAEAEKYGIKVY
ncbi:hypothetical protein E3E31_04120 [Thermococcus sp. M39]|uniref:hypothetical protein n=1 Tax=unclassified Thermococcus TaxID=2627626 RepID=UPI001439D55D|nr:MULTISPECIES: hypothetical protein [unclassified Thermococcus]NJE07715.1 hypothetical protein [Thermococcus sp. M39]NJE12271.1 hypothetical protein [Thermococcus sp. LS2]